MYTHTHALCKTRSKKGAQFPNGGLRKPNCFTFPLAYCTQAKRHACKQKTTSPPPLNKGISTLCPTRENPPTNDGARRALHKRRRPTPGCRKCFTNRTSVQQHSTGKPDKYPHSHSPIRRAHPQSAGPRLPLDPTTELVSPTLSQANACSNKSLEVRYPIRCGPFS